MHVSSNIARIVLRTLTVVVLSAGPAVAGPTPDKITFDFRPKLGKVVRMNVVTKTVGTMKMPDPMPEQKFVQTYAQSLKVTCVKINSDGSCVYEASMPRIGMSMNMGGFEKTFEYDSEKPDKAPTASGAASKEDITARIFKAMTQVKFNVITDSQGRPVRVEGFAESFKKILDNVEASNAADKAVLNVMRDFFNDDAMLEQVKGPTIITPRGRAVAIGETWENREEMTLPMFNMPMEVRTEHTLLGVEEYRGRMCAKIRIKQTIKALPRDAGAKTGAFPFTMDFRFEVNDGKGIAYYDYENDLLVSVSNIQRAIGEMKMKPNPEAKSPPEKQGFGPIVMKLTTSGKMDLVEPKQ